MKTLIASAVIALGLLSTAAQAQAHYYSGYPAWAQLAFEAAS